MSWSRYMIVLPDRSGQEDPSQHSAADASRFPPHSMPHRQDATSSRCDRPRGDGLRNCVKRPRGDADSRRTKHLNELTDLPGQWHERTPWGSFSTCLRVFQQRRP